MIPLAAPELQPVANLLRRYELRSTLTRLGGLLTVPNLQANTIRIETLVHLAVAHCRGNRIPSRSEIGDWLNSQLGSTKIASLEDPVEDVFITNVETSEGNRRLFEGIWESSDYFTQVVLDTLRMRRGSQEWGDLLSSAYSILKLSDSAAERVGLQRWCFEPSTPKYKVKLPSSTQLRHHARAIVFTDEQLDALGIERETLAPFILRDQDRQALSDECTGHTSLERRPLVDFGNELVLALPHAVGPAIRRFVLSELKRLGALKVSTRILAGIQAEQVKEEGLLELRNETHLLELPKPDKEMPLMHSMLLRYDLNKYLHVVLLHDNLDDLDTQGLSSMMQYPEELMSGLSEYLNRVALHCQGLPDFAEGMTLVVMGGLGRGFALSFKEWPHRWRLSVIRISDLLMLAGEPAQPIMHYLKFIKQKEWAEDEGVCFWDISGDYNSYCFWRNNNYQLVPHDCHIRRGAAFVIENDMVLPVRKEVRRLVDRHVLETTDGFYSSVIRLGKAAYFESMKDRPIYGSLGHLYEGVLAGAVETPRGPSWLVMEPIEGSKQVGSLLYDMWSGFIGLYDRLVAEVEARYPDASTGAVEIRLDFSEVILSQDYVEPQPTGITSEPEVNVNLQRRTARVNFPSDFLVHFQQHENTGERLVLRGIARGLVSLHQCVTDGIDEVVLDNLIGTVIDRGARILHLFRTHYPIKQLLVQQQQKPVFLSHPDLVFSRLRLSEGCTEARLGTSIASKHECNEFLHRVVKRVWNELRGLLHSFDRASVILQVLKVHEAAIQDRDHWHRTAQAVLALYAPKEDVFAVAQERESDRTIVSVSARTVLEMAICECPEIGGRQLSRWDLDELLAKAALLIEVATDSDAIHYDLTESMIHLHPNGEYTLNREFYTSVIRPFKTDYFQDEFEGAARDYERLYRNEQPNEPLRAEDVLSVDFIQAFETEFGLTPDEAMDGVAALMDLAVEHDSVVVETTLRELIRWLITVGGLSPETAQVFIRAFSIFHRPEWDRPPVGFMKRDINPWRFRRRLSAASRPVLVFGEKESAKVFFGAGMLKQGVTYLLERSENGELPQEFFTSQEMKEYIGAVNNERVTYLLNGSLASFMREGGTHVQK